MKPQRPGWTLIEMLACMAVIAVLIGILLPVLSRSIAASREVACLAAARSYAQSTHAYAGDWRDLPPAMLMVYPDDQYVWPDNYQNVRFLTPGGGFGQVHYSIQGWLSIYTLLHAAYLPYEAALCPTQRRDADLTGQRWTDEESRANYAIPEVFYYPPEVYRPGAVWRDESAAYRVQRLTDVRYPGAKVMVFEQRAWHLRGQPRVHEARESGRGATISTTDGRALTWRLTGSLPLGANSALGYEHPSPWLTQDGINGTDFQ